MEKIDLFLALARCSFLTCQEKEFLAENLDNLESLTVLSIEDISYRVQRVIRTRCWQGRDMASLVQRDREIMRKFDIQWVSVFSSEYPPLLREIHDSPFVLFWRGTLPNPEKPLVAIVGTRSPTVDGSMEAERLARDFTECGVNVVSGLANGIDASAHRGCVDSGGASVAVLACGVDQVYPRSNRHLAARLVEHGGCIIGEYSPCEAPLRFRFPQRNRIISGLCRAVIVVEAPEKSGALITADFALEQGRDLYVNKSTLLKCRSVGCMKLFDEGAPAITDARSILNSWNFGKVPSVSGLDDLSPSDDHFISPETQRCASFSSAIGKQLALDFRMELGMRSKRRC